MSWSLALGATGRGEPRLDRTRAGYKGQDSSATSVRRLKARKEKCEKKKSKNKTCKGGGRANEIRVYLSQQ